jgi:EmrB/QacA subfamily drug resistance transporter
MARPWKVLIVDSVAVLMVSLDLFIVNVAFPRIAQDFGGASVATVSWVLNAYAIVVAALMVPAGRLADRHGRRRVFLAGFVVFLASSALCGIAPSVGALIAARVAQAVGAALLLPTSLGLLLPEFPPAKRATAIGVWAAISGLAAAAGPPLGGLLVQASWRWVFFVNVPIGLVALVFAVRLLHESRDDAQERPDLLGAGVLTIAVGLLALGLVKAPDWGWGSTRTLLAFAVSAAGLVVFAQRCRRHPSPVLEPSMLAVRSFALANLSALLFSAAFAAMILADVLFMTGVWHKSVLTAGVALTPGPFTAALFAAPAGRVADRVGQARLGALGVGCFGLGCAWWAWRVGATPDYAGRMLPGLLISGLGVGLALPSLASAAASSLPPARFATGSAVYTMARQLGYVLGVSILVAVLDTHTTDPLRAFDRGWLFCAFAAGLGMLAALAIGRLREPAAAPPTTQPEPVTVQP